MKAQTGATEPLRDWFPLSAVGPFVDVTDLLTGLEADWGTIKCGCHPNCGIGTALHGQQADQEVGAAPDVPRRRALPRRRADDLRHGARPRADQGADGAQPAAQLPPVEGAGRLPADRPAEEVRQAERRRARRPPERARARATARATSGCVMFVAGMWFQDLWTYDFRRTEMCIIPYATQMGEISFCAYNTGVGWRQIVEKMHQNATVAEWYKEHGKHAVYANPKKAVPLPNARAGRAEDPEGRPARRLPTWLRASRPLRSAVADPPYSAD